MQCISRNSSESQCTWRRTEPSFNIYAMYSIIIPTFALFGCLANSLNAIVFMRPKMAPSVFTYLAVLSWVDSLCCIIIFLTCISRSVMLNAYSMIYFDLQLQSALFGTLTGAANWILATVTMDRIVYLCHKLPQTPPKFCTRPVARIIVCVIIFMSAILNSPYYFVFKTQDDGSFFVTNFYKSKFYKIYNWFSFTVLCIIPGLFLLFGNIAVIIMFRRWVKMSKSMSCSLAKNNPATRMRQEHQLKLTITIIIVVFLYLTGELPAHITSRKNAVNLLFGGDISKINFSRVEKFECFFLSLNAFQLTFNILVYAVINPAFMTEFFIFLRQMSDFIYRILGFNAVHKCMRKVRNRCQTDFDAGDFENRASISYYNEAFTVDDEEQPDPIILKIETIEKNMNYVPQKTKSCLDLNLDSEERYRCERVVQRHSMSF